MIKILLFNDRLRILKCRFSILPNSDRLGTYIERRMEANLSPNLRKTFSNLSQSLFNSDKLYDCTVKVGKDGNSKKFRVIKAHLANISQVLAEQLFDNF